MTKIPKLCLLLSLSVVSSCLLSGCGSNDTSMTPEAQNAMLAPKGPMSPEMQKKMQEDMARMNKTAPSAPAAK